MERKKWVDGARALAMIFVIFGHSAPNADWALMFTSPIKIPLFFILSGYLFNDHKGDISSFTKNKLKKLVLPYFALSIIGGVLNAAMWIATGSDPVKIAKNVVESIVIGERLWFIPCLILCEFFMFLLIKCTRKVNLTFIVSAVFMALTLIFIKDGTKLPWGVDKVPVMTFVMITGYFFRHNEKYFGRFVNTITTVIFGAVYIVLILAAARLTDMKIMDIHNSEYVGIFTIPQILAGCGFIILLLHKVKIPGFLTYVGQNTLSYYAFHTFAMVVLSAVAEKLLNIPSGSTTAGVVITAITLVIMVIPSEFINRFMPWMVGKKAKKIM